MQRRTPNRNLNVNAGMTPIGGAVIMSAKFTEQEVSTVAHGLLHGEMDTWQAAEFLQIFFTGHGFGLSHDAAVRAAALMGSTGCDMEVVRRELDRLALVM
jgi:hypothetical protein